MAGCSDGAGNSLDTGFGVGWSNNLNEGLVRKIRVCFLTREHVGKIFRIFFSVTVIDSHDLILATLSRAYM